MINKSNMWLWAWSAVGWMFLFVCIAIFPSTQVPAMLILVIILTSKSISLLDGIYWIWDNGLQATIELRTKEDHPNNATATERRALLFDEFAESPRQISLFGVFDWRWFQQIESCGIAGGLRPTISTILYWSRNVLYRFEALMVLSALALVWRPYSGGKWGASEWIAAVMGLVVIVNVTFMAVEILFGNVIMGPGYDRYCHRRVEEPICSKTTDGRELLRSVWNFVRLIAFSLIAIAALLHSLHAADSHKGFCGIRVDSATSRPEAYGEFIAFTLTTFATVGYGDVYPQTLKSRLMVAFLHGTPVMGVNLWGVSPLCDSGNLRRGQYTK
ncbi:MAG: hypothetical protein ACI8P0_004282 [Planctomycetaceae bacterium]|jgi:hypothetical protein